MGGGAGNIQGKLSIKYCMQPTLAAGCIIQMVVRVLDMTWIKWKAGGVVRRNSTFFFYPNHLVCLERSICYFKQGLVSVHVYVACVIGQFCS